MGIKPFVSNPWIHGYQTFCIKPFVSNLLYQTFCMKTFGSWVSNPWIHGYQKISQKKEDIKMDDQKK
jgi:hypothetical protein